MMEQTNHSTDTLLASFQAGNMAAFSQLYNLHINVLFNYGLKLTIDKELLKDCIHDIFVKLYTKKDELGTIDNLKSYLFISLKNKDKIILLASHDLDDLKLLCDKIYFIENGRVKDFLTEISND